MDSDKLPNPSMAVTKTLSTSLLEPYTGSATGNPRNKCALKPGHSLMDWIRLGNSGADLSGTGGRLTSVSKEELGKHNKINDAWMALRGVVYNITQYMEFHPGGVEELMRGVGTDATKLFNETHSWVNYSQLLHKCRIGPLVNKVKMDNEIQNEFTLPVKNFLTKPPVNVQKSDIVPRLDWIQKRDNVTLYFYTKQFSNPGLIIQKLIHEDSHLDIWIIIASKVHLFNFELRERVNWPPENIHISTDSGKIEVKLRKHDDHIKLWDDLGKYKTSKMFADALEPEIPLEFKIFLKYKFNHDSFVMLLQNENIIYSVPVGYHLTIEDLNNEQKINKCYTPIPKNYIKKYVNTDMDIEHLHFLIKHYPNANSFSQYLYDLKENTKIKVSLPKGNLTLSTLAGHRKFCFCAAGSGLTPFLSLIDHLLNRNTNRIEFLKLLYFNKTIEDIWINEMLQDISERDERFKFVNILSRPDDCWSGLSGRVSSDIIFPIGYSSIDSFSYIAACGPIEFIKNVEKILSQVNFPKENFFIF